MTVTFCGRLMLAAYVVQSPAEACCQATGTLMLMLSMRASSTEEFGGELELRDFRVPESCGLSWHADLARIPVMRPARPAA